LVINLVSLVVDIGSVIVIDRLSIDSVGPPTCDCAGGGIRPPIIIVAIPVITVVWISSPISRAIGWKVYWPRWAIAGWTVTYRT